MNQQLSQNVLLTGVEKCGFVLPGTVTRIKDMRGNDSLFLISSLIQDLKYYELILGNTVDQNEIQKLF